MAPLSRIAKAGMRIRGSRANRKARDGKDTEVLR